jgi:pheromone shutdown protein TraB
MIEKRTSIEGTTVVYFGVSHWQGEAVQDKLQEYEQSHGVDFICAEAPPNEGFKSSSDQQSIISHLEVFSTPVVMMDSDSRIERDNLEDEFGSDTIKQLSQASRSEMKDISPEFFKKMIVEREKTMRSRIKRAARKSEDGIVVVIVGSLHLAGLTN